MKLSHVLSVSVSVSVLSLVLVACSSDSSGDGSSTTGGGAPTSPLGPACKAASDCPTVTCDCTDGSQESLGQTCVGGVCYTADTCKRLSGYCGAHGGVKGGTGAATTCSQLSDCKKPAYCSANTNGTCPPMYLCANGYCVSDDACANAPATCQ